MAHPYGHRLPTCGNLTRHDPGKRTFSIHLRPVLVEAVLVEAVLVEAVLVEAVRLSNSR